MEQDEIGGDRHEADDDGDADLYTKLLLSFEPFFQIVLADALLDHLRPFFLRDNHRILIY